MEILEEELEDEKKKRLDLESKVEELKSMVESLTNATTSESKVESE